MVNVAAQDHFQDLRNIFETDHLRHIPRRGIVHVGADIGQEVPQYLDYGFEKIVLIEANPRSYETLEAKFSRYSNITMFNYAICDRSGVIDFHIHSSRSGSTEPASVLPMKRFKEIVTTLRTVETIKVPAITLDCLAQRHDIAVSDYNFLNVDIQGAELLAFRGATKLICSLDVIISEVNLIELYEHGALEGEIVTFLADHGFEKRHAVYHTLYDERSTFPAWGECLFVRRGMTQSAGS